MLVLYSDISFKPVKLSPNALGYVFERVGHYLVHFLIFIIYYKLCLICLQLDTEKLSYVLQQV